MIDNTTTVLYISLPEKVIEVTILILICLVSLVGNISLWIIIIRRKALKTNSNALILCLSSADISISAINVPFVVSCVIIGRWTISEPACVVLGFIAMVTFIGSVVSLAVISINRYIMICHAHLFVTVFTKRNTAFFILGTWVLSVLLAIPPLFGWGEYAYLPGQSICFCNWPSSISYTFFMVGVCFGGPCSVMSFCYIQIWKEFRRSKQRLQQFKKSDKKDTVKDIRSKQDIISTSHLEIITKHEAQSYNNGSSTQGSSIKKNKKNVGFNSPCQRAKEAARKRRQEEVKLVVSSLVVIVTFIICWLPFCVTMFLSVFMTTPVPRIPDMITLLLGCFNSSCNPIIYGIMNRNFRAGFADLYCKFRRNRVNTLSSGTVLATVS